MTTKAKAQTDDAPPVVGFDDPADPVQEAADRVAEGEARDGAGTDPQADGAAAARLRAQYGEYGQWVAAYDLQHEGALAYAAGHPVPASLVDGQGRVVTSMHRCHHPEGVRCDRFNTPDEWSEPGAARRPSGFQE